MATEIKLQGIELPLLILVDEQPITLEECYKVQGFIKPSPVAGKVDKVADYLSFIESYKRENTYEKFKWVSLVLFQIPRIQFPETCKLMGYWEEYLEEYFGEYYEQGNGD